MSLYDRMQSCLEHPWFYRGMAGLILAVYFAICSTTAAVKGNTFDEGLFLSAGMTMWRHNDYHVMPEGGNLYQRVASLPLVFRGAELPPADEPNWPLPFDLADQLFFELSNDAADVLWWGRLPTIVCGMLFGWVVFCWASSLWGRGAGLVSLLLYAFSPTILASSSVATADLFTSGMMLLSLGAFWMLLHRMTIPWFVASCLAVGGLSATKHSFVAIAPVFVLLILLRLWSTAPIQIRVRSVAVVSSHLARVVLFAGLCLGHIVAIFVVQWALFGFSYEDPNPQVPRDARYVTDVDDYRNAEGALPALISFCHDYRLLPEACLYGVSFQYQETRRRSSFLMGEYGDTGFWYFFPVTFLIKTPVPWLLVILAVIWAAWLRWRRNTTANHSQKANQLRNDLYQTAPLWGLLIVYWLFVLTSKINIGHRHLLPIYPAICVLGGASIWWIRRGARFSKIAISLVLAWVVVGCLLSWPNYIAFFNVAVGGPKNGYRYLVDSSLDWGQDLPTLRRWLEADLEKDPDRGPVYLAYFGTGKPHSYVKDAILLPQDHERATADNLPRRTIARQLRPGTYCISATQLQGVYDRPHGPWTVESERRYREDGQLLEMLNTPELADKMNLQQGSREWRALLYEYDLLRFKRLCRHLLKIEPDAFVGYSILIYRINEVDLAEALYGPRVGT